MLENLIKIGWNFLLLLPWHLTDLRRTKMGSLCCLINGFCFWEWPLKLCGNCCMLYEMKKWGVLRSNKVEKMKCINWKTSFPFRRNLRPLGADADSFSKLIWQADIKQSKGEAECSKFNEWNRIWSTMQSIRFTYWFQGLGYRADFEALPPSPHCHTASSCHRRSFSLGYGIYPGWNWSGMVTYWFFYTYLWLSLTCILSYLEK